MSQSSVEAFCALGLGFAFAGVLASGFEACVKQRLSVAALRRGGLAALACLPVLIFSAPFLILRDIAAGRRSGVSHVPFVVAATVAAGFWGLMSGRIVFDVARFVAGA